MAKEHWSKTLSNPFWVRATPKASSNRIKAERLEDGSMLLRVYVTAVPESGKANHAVIKLLAKALGVPKSALAIQRGETDRNKLIKIDIS